MLELIRETFSSVKQHKTRTILTGSGITWGMFILILLLGIGNGFRHGTVSMFEDYASNSIWVTGGTVSEATVGGRALGTAIRFDARVFDILQSKMPEIQFIAPEVTLGGGTVCYGHNAGQFEIKGVGPDYKKVKRLNTNLGRGLNELDFTNRRRNVIIGEQVRNTLFGKDVDPVGESITISGVCFKVVGIIASGTLFGLIEENSVYMSDQAFFHTFGVEMNYATFGLIVENKGVTSDSEDRIREYLSQEIGFSSGDNKALYINNVQMQVDAFNYLFNGLEIFLWFVGGCVLLCGVIGVANIMFLAAKERTKEFGIRKAIGATSESILLLLTAESLFITTIFGVLGMFFGYFGIGLYNEVLSLMPNLSENVFGEASISNDIVFAALALLIMCGVMAGILPARKAASVMPIEALNQED